MNINPSRRARAVIYLINVIGTPVAIYLNAKGILGDLEMVLWGAEVTVTQGLAAINTPAPPAEPERSRT